MNYDRHYFSHQTKHTWMCKFTAKKRSIRLTIKCRALIGINLNIREQSLSDICSKIFRRPARQCLDSQVKEQSVAEAYDRHFGKPARFSCLTKHSKY